MTKLTKKDKICTKNIKRIDQKLIIRKSKRYRKKKTEINSEIYQHFKLKVTLLKNN